MKQTGSSVPAPPTGPSRSNCTTGGGGGSFHLQMGRGNTVTTAGDQTITISTTASTDAASCAAVTVTGITYASDWTITTSSVTGTTTWWADPPVKKSPLQEFAERVWAEEDPTDAA